LTQLAKIDKRSSVILATVDPDVDELRSHYDFDYTKMKPNPLPGVKKVYKQTYVVLDEDVSKVFQSSEDVNVVLRSAIRAMRTAAAKPRVQKRRAS
jgi:hypothetical protein